jgi:hypothetical protein
LNRAEIGRNQSLLLVLAAVLSGGCATTVRVSLPVSEQEVAELNGITADREARITIAGSPELPSAPAKAVKIDPVTTRWLARPRRDWQPRSVPTDDLDTVLVLNRGRGALEGLGWGLLVGGLAGLVAGADAGRSSNPALPGAVVGGIVAVVGGVIGVALGAAVSHTTSIEFCPAR